MTAASIGFAFHDSIRRHVLRRYSAIRKTGTGGSFLTKKITTRRRYRGETLILETELETPDGAVRLIDFMPPRGENPDIVRIIEGLRGKVSMQMELIIRFDYGHIVPWVRKRSSFGGLEAIAGPDGLILRTPVETHGKDLTTTAEFTVAKGDRIPFVLTWFASHTIRRERSIPSTHCAIRKCFGEIGRNNLKAKGNGEMRWCAH